MTTPDEPESERQKALPPDLERLSPEEAAAALKLHNPPITVSTEFLAETIRRAGR